MKIRAALIVLALLSNLQFAFTQETATGTAGSSALMTSSVPRLIRFSGVAKDADGKPLTGTIGITFLLYKDQESGAPLWMETQNVQPDSNGHYSVQLGATQANGLPTDVFTSGEARWLGVQPQGQAEQPRVMLLAVPYALKAADAETLGGKPLSSFQLVPPQSKSSSSQKTQTPAEQLNEIACAGSTACKTSFIPKFSTNGGSAKVSNSIISQSGANVAIAGSENVKGNINSGGNLSASGNVSANGNVGASTMTAGASGNTIVATMSGNTAQTAAVTGIATATGVGNTYGVAGYTSTGNGVGVFGQSNDGGTALYGLSFNGTGVFGSGINAWGFDTDSNVRQARTMGGWVKAMVYINGQNAPYGIINCFNSTLAGAAATTPPCGINFTENRFGEWILDFGFEVDDRFLSTNIYNTQGAAACISAYPFTPPTVIIATVYDCSDILNPRGGYFHLVVF